MPRKSPPKRKLKKKETPAQQYARFLEMAEELGTSKDPKDFDKAFKKITKAR